MSLWETIDELLDDPANTSNSNQSQAQSVQKIYNEDELDENELLGINEEEEDLFGDLSGSENVVSESRSNEKSYPVSIQASSSDLAIGSEDDLRENFRPSVNKSNGSKSSEFFFSTTSVDKTADEDGLDIGQADGDDLIENNKAGKERTEYKSETEKSASETDLSTKRTDEDEDDETDEKRTSRSSHWSERNVDKPKPEVDNSNAQNYNNRRNFNNNNNRNNFNNRPVGGMNNMANMNKRPPHMNGQDGLLPIPQLMQQSVPRPNNSMMYQQKPQQPNNHSMGGPFFNTPGNQLIRPMLDSNNMNMMQQFKTTLGMNQFVPNQFGLQQQAPQHPIQQQSQMQAPMQLQQQPRPTMMQYPSMNQNSFQSHGQPQRYPHMMNTAQPMNNQTTGMFQNQNDLAGAGMMNTSQVVMSMMSQQSQFMMNQFQKPNMGQNAQPFPMMPSQQNVMPAPQQPQPTLLNSLMSAPQVVLPQAMTQQQQFSAIPTPQQVKPNHVFINPSFIAKQNQTMPSAVVSNNEEKKPARSRKDLDMLLEKRLAEELSKSREDEKSRKKAANSPPPLKRKSTEMSSDKQSSKHNKIPRQNENKRHVEAVSSSSSSSNVKRASTSESEKSVDKSRSPPPQVATEQTTMIVIDDPDYFKKLEEQKRKREEVLRMKNEKRNQRILELKKTENLNGHSENTQKSSTSSSSSSGFGSRTVIQISSDQPTGRRGVLLHNMSSDTSTSKLASLCSAIDVKHKSTR